MPFGLGEGLVEQIQSPYLWLKIAATLFLAIAGICSSALAMKAFADHLVLRRSASVGAPARSLFAFIFWLVLGIWSPWLPISTAMLVCGTFVVIKLQADRSDAAVLVKCAAFAAITLGMNGVASAIWSDFSS